MIRIFLLCLIILVPFAFPVYAQDTANQPVVAESAASSPVAPTMYRNFIFGVSKEDVRKYETAVFYKEEGDSLYFLYEPDLFRRMIRYDFVDDRLAGIEHYYEELWMANPYRIIEMAQDEEMALGKLYGEPDKRDFLWKDRRYEKIIEAWGRSLYSRDLQIRSTWEKADARITLMTYFDGNYYQIRYRIEPSSSVTAPEDKKTNAIDLGLSPPAANASAQKNPVTRP